MACARGWGRSSSNRDVDGEVWLEGGVSRGGRRLFAGLELGLGPLLHSARLAKR